MGEGAKRVSGAPGEDADVLEHRAHERLLAAHARLDIFEFLEAGHLGDAVGGAPGGNGRQFQFVRIVGIGAGLDDRVMDVPPAAFGGLGRLAHRRLVAGGLVHGAVERRVLPGETDVGDADIGDGADRIGGAGPSLGASGAELLPALLGHRVEKIVLVLEVMIGRRRTDPGLPGDAAQRERRRPLGLQDPSAGLDEGPRQIPMVIGAGDGVRSFSHGGHRKT